MQELILEQHELAEIPLITSETKVTSFIINYL
jgi:hypothetical protein